MNQRSIRIQHAFHRLLPTSKDEPDLKGALSKCLLYAENKFLLVEDEYIRGCFRIMAKLPSRGLKRLHNGAVLSEQQLASPIIRWTTPQDDEEQAVQQYLEVTLEKAATPHILYA
ncbi:uncharacterized protein LOC131689535 [Topomyia yanbarensis]|uniref:uncharacterized protein LOC131689535 n=1 Tax=Topomyia yanbarensis TaxID=2498891 RepID=UPI00273AEECD|nr:uncharacterized protein LOC131689535 [Topomyia yanbarensis]